MPGSKKYGIMFSQIRSIKNKTTLFITVDHGRGDIEKEKWTSHNNKIQDAHEIWFAVMGPDTPVRGN